MLQLKPLFNKYDYHIITEKDKSTKGLKGEYKDKISYVPYGTRSKLIRYLFVFMYLCLKTIYLYFKIRPEYIVTTGTHTAVPMCYIAHMFKKKVIFIETFANSESPTRSGKMVYPIADVFIVQWESMLKFYPNAICKGGIYWFL